MKKNNPIKGSLTIVSLPIGNLKDITLRAIETLESSDTIYCEDTRTTIKLTNHYNIKTPLKSYHEHSTSKVREKIITELNDGKNISLVSDAGTPLISDPGYKLIKDLQDKGLKISSAPGVSSPIMALTLSGIPTDKFLFIGFLPIKNSARRDYLLDIQYISASIIIFESAKRINKTLAELNEIFGNRGTSVCRELTKKFEEIISGNIESVIADLSNRESLKGEIVIVLEGFSDAYKKDIDIESMLLDALPIMSASEASKEVSKFTNLSRKEVYNIALKLKGKIKNDT